MKKLFTVLFSIAIAWQVCAQKAVFVRVYDSKGKKIERGRIAAITDTSVQLKVGETDTVNILVANIGSIKTNHSAAHYISIGALAGGLSVGILGLVVAKGTQDLLMLTASEGIRQGVVYGAIWGTAIGVLIAILKKPKAFTISGDLKNWKSFKNYISERNSQSK